MFNKFFRNTSGNIAMMFGLLTVPLIAATGAAIDYSRAYEQRMVVQDALDAAALAANRMIGNATNAQIIAEAQAFFNANIAGRLDTTPTISVQIDSNQGTVVITTDLGVPTNFLGIIGIDNINFDIMARTVTGGRDLEVALVLDITESMLGTKIAALRTAATSLVNMVVRDVQTPFYSKLALIPFSMGVNVGTYAASVRGATTAGRTVTAVTPWAGTAKTLNGFSKNTPNPPTTGRTRLQTGTAHGLTTGDTVYITGISGGSGWTNLNGNLYVVTVTSTTQFWIAVNSNSWSGSPSGGTVRECYTASCELVVTAASHGLASGSYAYVTGLAGSLGTLLNNKAWTVGAVTALSGLNATNNFVLTGTTGTTAATYTSGGTAYCLTVGCQYYRFTNASSGTTILPVSTCTSERLGTYAYTDHAPGAGAYVGWNYVSTDNPCPGNQIVPLTSNRTTLNAQIATYQAVGSTAGQIGAAWGWYMLSPNFATLWPAASRPAAYNTDELLKVVVFMTDGVFNTGYCNNTISKNYYALSSSANRSNCNATNGNPSTQALTLCTAMKAEGIVVYTVGFDMAGETAALDLLEDCASSPNHFYIADNGADLQLAFAAIGTEISRLRIAE